MPKREMHLGSFDIFSDLYAITSVPHCAFFSTVAKLQRTFSSCTPVSSCSSFFAISSVIGKLSPSKFCIVVGSSGIIAVIHFSSISIVASFIVSWIVFWHWRIC